MQKKPYSKKWAIIGFSCFALIWIFSLIFYSPYLSNVPFFARIQSAYQLLNGYSTPINGRMWRINETNYLVVTKGSIVNVRSTYPLGNYSNCYAITLTINSQNLAVSFDRVLLPYLKTQMECLG